MLCLVARHEGTVLKVPIPDGEARIGSAPGNDIVLPFRGVSRRHALIARSGSGTELVDLGSKNGLVVGTERTDRVRLAPGVVVRLGPVAVGVEQLDSDEFDVALPAHTVREQGERRGAATRTDSVAGEADGEAFARALQLIRRCERAGDRLAPAQRQELASEAAVLLGASALVLLDDAAGGTAGPAIAALAGTLPPAGLLESVVAGLSGGRSSRRPRVQRSGADVALVAGPVADSRGLLVAILAPGLPGPRAWQLDLLDYVREKLAPGASPSRGNAAHELAGPAPLRIPQGMILGRSPAMTGLLDQIRATVRSRLDVVLLGETGVGKELFARMIHASGPDALGPFVAINCAAIPSELLEAELFGVKARSATGVDPRPGHFVLADGGSLFLDEVSELAEPLQAKLLRALQEREVLPVGASSPRKVSVRVISASNTDLPERVEQGRFRADLYFRIRGLEFRIPPLRERTDDVPDLVLAFVERAAEEYGKTPRGVSRRALDLLLRHGWPGNVRELESEVRRAVLLCPDGGIIQSEHFGPVVPAGSRRASVGAPAAGTPSAPPAEPVPQAGLGLKERLDRLERQAIDEALAAARGNKSLAAKLLGITRNGLAMKLGRRRAPGGG